MCCANHERAVIRCAKGKMLLAVVRGMIMLTEEYKKAERKFHKRLTCRFAAVNEAKTASSLQTSF